VSLDEESEESLKRRGLKRSPDWPYCITPFPLPVRGAVPGYTEAYKEQLRKRDWAQEALAHEAVIKANEVRQREICRLWEERERAERLKPPVVPVRIFAKSVSVAEGLACYPHGCVPFEGLSQYGTFAVLSTTEAIIAEGASLKLIGGSTSALTLSHRIGRGSLALGQASAAVGSGVATGLLAGTVAMLWPNNFASDSAFYRAEDFANLTVANTSVRLNVKYLPEESVTAFGVYTGNHRSWQNVPVIAATPRGEQLIADLGDGIELIWTPAVNPRDVLGIPALEGAPQLSSTYVFPKAEEVEQWYDHPTHPPDYRDAIIWFPSKPEIAPVYISLNVREAPGVATGVGEDVTGIWLAGAGEGLGSPIPTRIADKLRGREFSSFDAFRKALWKTVAADPELGGQFIPANIKRIVKDLAPTVRVGDQRGRRISFELHHVERVADGGAVYDMDNLRVTTPKNHMNIHKVGQ
jgi:hypothetical protein